MTALVFVVLVVALAATELDSRRRSRRAIEEHRVFMRRIREGR